MSSNKLRIFHTKTPNKKYTNEVVVLEEGGKIIIPTDTFYALGCLSNKKEL